MPEVHETELSRSGDELEPLVTNLLHVMAKSSMGYQIMKREAKEFRRRMGKAGELAGIIIQTEDAMSKISESEAKSLVRLFQYLGYVESIGVTLIDLVVLLLIANGYQLHAERLHDLPSIIHVSSLEELTYINLASKLGFLEMHGMKNLAKMINRNLRNDIAHLNFSIDDKGKIDTSHKKNLDIEHEITRLKFYITYINALFEDQGFREWLMKV